MQWIVGAVLILALTGCSSNSEDKSEKSGKDKETNETVAVEKGLLSVEVTIPQSFLDEENPDDIIASAKEEGIEVKKNEDGSLTYHMTKAQHKKMLKDMKEGITKSVAEFEENEDMPSVKKIDHNGNFSKFTVTVDREAYENSFDGFVVFGLGMGGLYYQLFEGGQPEQNKVTLEMKDEQTGEVFNKVTYPDDLPNADDEQDSEG
ncbi:hypothetical protein DVB69_05300 [Sporosarcina sp. BI001-red]|nr:hypothetical protein DVB69_05300 [Sporosarcina sp. BI001-red]